MGEWISVDYRLPEEYGEYFITWEALRTKPMIAIAEYEPSLEYDYKENRFKGNWIFDEYMDAYDCVRVLAWMPLPKPYMGREGK